MTIRPLKDQVFVKPIRRPDTTPSGLVMPETVGRPEFIGTVIAVGPKVSEVKARDVVIFGLWNGQEHLVNNEPCLVMRESALLAVWERPQ